MGDRKVFDRVLIDPDAAALDAALRDARAVANEGNDSKSKHLAWPPADLPSMLQRIGTVPDGLHGWHGGKKAKYYAGKSQVTVAWWTNMLGERHVRVLGGHGLTTGARLRIGDSGQFHGGTPLSYAELLYPERTARVEHAGSRPALVGVCDCGAVGSFAALGWTGPCCGPCRDHRMDGNPAPPVPWLAVGANDPPSGRRVTSLAFDPAGGSLLVTFAGVRRWHIATGTVEPVPHPPGVTHCGPVTFLPDGKRAVLFGSRGSHAEYETAVAVWEPGTVEGSQWHLPPGRAALVRLAPDGETVATYHQERANTKPKLRIRAARDGKILHELGTPEVRDMLFSPDGRRLLVTSPNDGPKLLDARTGKLIHEFPDLRQSEQVFHPNGRDIYAISDTVAAGGATYDGGGMRMHLVKYPLTGTMYYMVNFLTVSPDRKVLVVGIFSSLYFWELNDGAVGEWCAFHLPSEALSRCAWFPDGRWLATADNDATGTVRLWPWPAVYEAARAAGT